MSYRKEYQERGVLRSGKRFAVRNVPYYLSEAELISHHKALLEGFARPSLRYLRVGQNQGNLLQATYRFHVSYPNIKQTLVEEFLSLFREHTESSTEGFEVVVTFNAIITNSENTTFSIFYGHDHRAGNLSGASPELKFGDTILVQSLGDVSKIPTSFDFETLARQHRFSFESSDVRVAEFINIIYLVYRFVDPDKRAGKHERTDARR